MGIRSARLICGRGKGVGEKVVGWQAALARERLPR
jgi:hypothetical protein